MRTVTYSAPSKVILSGEHAVVYGKPALVSGLALYCTVTISEAETQMVIPEAYAHIPEIVEKYLEKQNITYTKRPYSVDVQFEMPLGRGLGSSASLSVATIAALLHFYVDREFDKETVNNLAYQAEKHFHGNPSGADNTTTCFGGLIFFRKEFEFLKTISALNFKLPSSIEKQLLLIDTGKPAETTAEMVKGVGKKYNDNPEAMDLAFMKIEKATKRMVVSIVKEDTVFFKQALLENQEMLETIDIVSDTAKKLLIELQPFGAGKVTGAGGKKEGSGFILFFADDMEAVQTFLDKKGVKYYPFQQDYKGLHVVSSL